MSSPAYQTITAALKLDQFGQEDGDVVLSGTRVNNIRMKYQCVISSYFTVRVIQGEYKAIYEFYFSVRGRTAILI